MRQPPADLCFQFATLAGASDRRIRRFAASYGRLGHEIGIQQNVSLWRHYARLAQAILRLAGEQHTGGRGSQEDWKTLWTFIEPNLENVKPVDTADVKPVDTAGMKKRGRLAVLSAAVNKWFSAAKGNGILMLRGDRLQVRIHGANLFGILIVQIAHVVARSDQMAICAGCTTPFQPNRPLCRGERQYCRDCRAKKLPQRDAARDYRQRRRSERRKQ